MNDTNDNDAQHGTSSAAASNNNSQVGAPSTQNNQDDDAPSTNNNSAATNNNTTNNNNNNHVKFSANNHNPSTQSAAQSTTNNDNQIMNLRQQSTTNSNKPTTSISGHPELPFLITHWLSNYTASLPSAAGAAEKERALQTIQNQSIILANAFETLGEFGTSSTQQLSTSSIGIDGSVPTTAESMVEGGTRSTTYADLKRKYSPLLQIGSSISKVGINQSERYVTFCVYCFYVVVRLRY